MQLKVMEWSASPCRIAKEMWMGWRKDFQRTVARELTEYLVVEQIAVVVVVVVVAVIPSLDDEMILLGQTVAR